MTRRAIVSTFSSNGKQFLIDHHHLLVLRQGGERQCRFTSCSDCRGNRATGEDGRDARTSHAPSQLGSNYAIERYLYQGRAGRDWYSIRSSKRIDQRTAPTTYSRTPRQSKDRTTGTSWGLTGPRKFSLSTFASFLNATVDNQTDEISDTAGHDAG
jgi:hypothetical protein